MGEAVSDFSSSGEVQGSRDSREASELLLLLPVLLMRGFAGVSAVL